MKAFINGTIYTMNPHQPYAEAVLIDAKKIQAVGTNAEIHAHSYEAEVIDLKGALMLPGLIDNHAHTVLGGLQLLSIDLTRVFSIDNFKAKVKNAVSGAEGKWITGGSWNHYNWEGAELPTREWLDPFSPDTPVFLTRMDYHIGVANSRALQLAGINKDTPDPEGGEIVKDPATGEPTGLLRDTAMDIVKKAIPPTTIDRMKEAIAALLDEAKRFGVTSIQDISYEGHFRALQAMERESKLTCRFYVRVPIEFLDSIIQTELENGFGSSTLRFGSVKAFADGSLGAATAYFEEPYLHRPGTRGIPTPIMKNNRLADLALKADEHNLQLSVHAIGDMAVKELLDIAAKLNETDPGKDRRFRIEHAQHFRKEDIERAAKLGVIISAQPYHLVEDAVYIEEMLGKERLALSYPFRSLLDAGAKVCFGSDYPVVTLNPLAGIYAAVTRIDAKGKYKDGCVPEEKISVEEAVRAYTIDAAYAAFEEDSKGSIEPGKAADFAVLSENIFSIPPEEIINTKVTMTVFDGNIIHRL